MLSLNSRRRASLSVARLGSTPSDRADLALTLLGPKHRRWQDSTVVIDVVVGTRKSHVFCCCCCRTVGSRRTSNKEVTAPTRYPCSLKEVRSCSILFQSVIQSVLMFQRKRSDDLPTSMSLPTGGDGGSGGGGGFPFVGGSSNSTPDGSGKAIKMDAPIVASWKKASGYTRGSYYVLLFFIMLLFVGYRYLRGMNGKNGWCFRCALSPPPRAERIGTASSFSHGSSL